MEREREREREKERERGQDVRFSCWFACGTWREASENEGEGGRCRAGARQLRGIHDAELAGARNRARREEKKGD